MGNQCMRTRQRTLTGCSKSPNYFEQQNFRTIYIKCSTLLTENGKDYYVDQISQIKQQNIQLHLKLKITSYLVDDLSYTNISHIISAASHPTTSLLLNFQNSLLKKRKIFKIIKDKLSSFHQLRVLHLYIGFSYIPNSTIKIFLDGLQKCKSLKQVKLDVQLDVFIKKHNDNKKVDQQKKKPLPNDKITYLVAHALNNCKNIEQVSLNFSQISQKDQDYKSFFTELKSCHHLLQLELLLNNCHLDDASLEMIGVILYENITMNAFIIHISNNNQKKISSIFKIYQKIYTNKPDKYALTTKNQSQLKEFGLYAMGFKATYEDLNQFVSYFMHFPKITSLQIQLHSNSYDIKLLTSAIYSHFKKINEIALNFSIVDDLSQSQKNQFIRYWRKVKRIVKFRNII